MAITADPNLTVMRSSTSSVPSSTKRARPQQTIGGGNFLDAVQHEADEAVALAPDARHHRAAIDLDRTIHRQAERAEAIDRVRGIRRSDQQLAGHAAHARAGGAVRTLLDEQRSLPGRFRSPVGGKPRGAGADDRHVGGERAHLGGGGGCHGGSFKRFGGARLAGPSGRHAGKVYAALFCCTNFSTASASPIRWPLTKTCGTVSAPEMAPTARERIVCGSGIST